MTVTEFIAKWSASGAAERANKDSFLVDLCDQLGVPRPHLSTGDPDKAIRPPPLTSKRGRMPSLSRSDRIPLLHGQITYEVFRGEAFRIDVLF
jgi:hypothetical protein